MSVLLSGLFVLVVAGVFAYWASDRRYQEDLQLTRHQDEDWQEPDLAAARSDHEFPLRDREPVA